MNTAQPRPAPGRTRHGHHARHSRWAPWLLATTGLALLVVSVVMMASGA